MVKQARVVDETNHGFPLNAVIEFEDYGSDGDSIFFTGTTKKGTHGVTQILRMHQFEWIEEEEDMKRTSNPKSFRNGDVIKISNKSSKDDTVSYGTYVFVKFGENYYNLSDGGQMKAYKYLPRGRKEVITNLSGLGEFFLMDPEDLRRQFADGEEAQEEIPFDGPGTLKPQVIQPADWERIVREMEKWSHSTDTIGNGNKIEFVTYGTDSATSSDYTTAYKDATHGK